LINFYKERHPQNDAALVVKFLLSYADTEKQPDPAMLVGFDWVNAKEILTKAVKGYLSV